MQSNNFLKRFFEEYANNATIDHENPQIRADQAARWFWNNLTGLEQSKLQAARIRALDDKEKRKEFNAVCKEIRRRLFKG